MIARLARLVRDRRGVTAVEFGFVLPPLLFMLMGGMDIAYQVYVQAILDGAIQKAGRDSGIQGGAENAATIDAKVLDMVKVVAKSAAFSSGYPKRQSYATFSAMKPETFTDTNGNGKRDAKECFDDINGNKLWDADPGMGGQGGANDVTLYTVRLRYERLFPVTKMLGWDQQHELTARTLLKNQPYASQTTRTTETVCS